MKGGWIAGVNKGQGVAGWGGGGVGGSGKATLD